MSSSVIVTGANTGLGFEAARFLLAMDPSVEVVLACRDAARAEAARRKLGERRVRVMTLDLSSLPDVRRFAAEVARDRAEGRLPPVRALVANAGMQYPGPLRRSADGYELTFATNHLGHYLLARLLARLLAPILARPGRIIFVASGTHDPAQRTGMPTPVYEAAGDLALAPLTEPDPVVFGARRYTTSKLCNVITAYELDRRLKAAGTLDIDVTAFDPGAMPSTGLAREAPFPIKQIWQIGVPLLSPLLRLTGFRPSTPRRSGRMLATMAIDPAYAGVSGAYVSIDRGERSSEESYDQIKASALWVGSAALVGLEP
jgi:NAD(P)-dependent dehydrogenase (short-subunit alcohol dehydrogenase family)